MSLTLGVTYAPTPPDPPPALFFLAGGVTDTTAQIKVRTSAGAPTLRLSTSEDLSSPTIVGPATPDANLYSTFDLTGLAPATQYHYGVETDAGLDEKRGKFRTAPVPGTAHSFTLVHSSCMTPGSNHPVFDSVMTLDPDVIQHLGDRHYGNIATNNQSLFRRQIEAMFEGARPAECFRSAAWDSTHDDHDAGPNNCDGTSASIPAAVATHSQCFPNYDLPSADSIEHAYTWGRVRVIVPDHRSHRSPNSDVDGPSKSVLGSTQLTWFKTELLAAQADPDIALIVYGCSMLWLDLDHTHTDSWSAFQYEQDDLVAWIAANITKGIIIISGDAHGTAYDDGTYSPGGIPVLQAAPLDRGPIRLGGPYSSGTMLIGIKEIPYRAHIGVFEVTDNGTAINVHWRAIRVNGTTGVETEMLAADFGPFAA